MNGFDPSSVPAQPASPDSQTRSPPLKHIRHIREQSAHPSELVGSPASKHSSPPPAPPHAESRPPPPQTSPRPGHADTAQLPPPTCAARAPSTRPGANRRQQHSKNRQPQCLRIDNPSPQNLPARTRTFRPIHRLRQAVLLRVQLQTKPYRPLPAATEYKVATSAHSNLRPTRVVTQSSSPWLLSQLSLTGERSAPSSVYLSVVLIPLSLGRKNDLDAPRALQTYGRVRHQTGR